MCAIARTHWRTLHSEFTNLVSQSNLLQNSSTLKPLYAKGIKGYTMMNKEGTGMTVPYSDVGRLCKKLVEMLTPLVSGPAASTSRPCNHWHGRSSRSAPPTLSTGFSPPFRNALYSWRAAPEETH